MAEHRYQARGPQNRTTLITIRVTAEHRELLHKLAAERGETLSRMLLDPWTGGKKQRSARRSAAVAAESPIVPEVPIERAEPEAPVVDAPGQPPSLEHPPGRPSRGRRVIPGQVELVLGDAGGER